MPPPEWQTASFAGRALPIACADGWTGRPPPRAASRRSRRCFACCGGTSRRRRLVEAFAETWESETAACHFIESIHPEDRASAEARWEQAIDAKHILDLTCRLRRGAKGSYRWTHVRALPLLDPDGAIRRLGA